MFGTGTPVLSTVMGLDFRIAVSTMISAATFRNVAARWPGKRLGTNDTAESR
jgi:hypothetical protein